MGNLLLMGLDVTLLSRLPEQMEGESCYGLSRTFCRLLCDLADFETDVPELMQLFHLYQVDGTPLLKANVWAMDKRVLYGAESGLSPEEINAYHASAWQPGHLLLAIFSALYDGIISDPSWLESLEFHYDWIKPYFIPFGKDGGHPVMNPSFADDLFTAREFLAQLPPGAEVRFHFF